MTSSAAPEPLVRDDDGELFGFVVPEERGWVPTTVFGFPLAPAVDRAVAVEILHVRGLAVLAERRWCDGAAGRLVEVAPDHVRWCADDGGSTVRVEAAEAAERLWPLAVPRSDAVRAGVGDNAAWCASVAAVQGVPSSRDDSVWSAGSPMPEFFPRVVTLREGVDRAAVLASVPGGVVAVKDSYADVELGVAGFAELLAGRWLAVGPLPRPVGARERVHVVASPEHLAEFATASVHENLDWAALQADPSVDLVWVETFGQHGWERLAQAVLSSGSVAVGISNVEITGGGSAPDTWRALGWYAGHRFPDRLVVGWEPVADLAGPLLAGFVDVGPLRVWVR